MIATIRKLADLLSRRERLQLAALFGGVLAMAFLEILSIGAVLPFLSVAADPAVVESNPWLARGYELLGFDTAGGFLVALGLLAFVLLLLSNLALMATIWAIARFAFGRAHSLGLRLLTRYAGRPYAFFLGRNSAALSTTVLNEVEQVTQGVMMALLNLLTRVVVALAIVGLLLAYDPVLATLVTGVLGGAYGVIYLVVRHRLGRLGDERLTANTARFKAVSELFGAIKDIKLLGREQHLLRAFAQPSLAFNRNRAAATVIGQTPRYLLEAIAFGGVVLIAVYMIAQGGALPELIPVLGLYAFAGYRLMPALQLIFLSATQLRFSMAALDNLHRDLAGWQSACDGAPSAGAAGPGQAMALHQRLELDRITFTYPGAAAPALADVTLSIAANTTVGFMGATGAGKTTLVDVVLGLLTPDDGEFRVDGVPVTKANLREWQSHIGYVPQHIYLSDDTIAANIALGIPADEINGAAVRRAAAIARIDRFVQRDLPAGYATVVGERGVRLSGGQRQRIGIARALYHDPSVLVLDEATSALDTATETAVMDAIQTLAGKRTILIIAHRLSTLEVCDVVYRVADGSVALASQPRSSRMSSYAGELG
jgi:ATP-binding cassette, subfamily B, bacterial PglK